MDLSCSSCSSIASGVVSRVGTATMVRSAGGMPSRRAIPWGSTGRADAARDKAVDARHRDVGCRHQGSSSASNASVQPSNSRTGGC